MYMYLVPKIQAYSTPLCLTCRIHTVHAHVQHKMK